jgi:plasmid stabilization system protein ParE
VSRPPFRVLWTETAALDLEEVVAFIAADSPGNAQRVLAALDGRRDLEEMLFRRLVRP